MRESGFVAIEEGSERSPRLIATAPSADPQESHPVRAGNRNASRLRVEAQARAHTHRHLLALDPPDAGAADDDVDLLLT